MIDDKLVEKFQDYNIFIGDVIRTPKVKKVSKGEQQYIFFKHRLLPIMNQLRCIYMWFIINQDGKEAYSMKKDF